MKMFKMFLLPLTYSFLLDKYVFHNYQYKKYPMQLPYLALTFCQRCPGLRVSAIATGLKDLDVSYIVQTCSAHLKYSDSRCLTICL